MIKVLSWFTASGWLFAACLFSVVQAAQGGAPLPFYEPFPAGYTEGERLGGATSGIIWDTGNSTGTGSATNTITAALSYNGLVASSGSRGILLTSTPSSNRDRGVTFIPAQAIAEDYPALYFSFLFRIQSPSTGTRALAYFRNSTSSGNPSAGVFIDSSSRLQIVKSGTAPAPGTTPPLGPGTHLVVLRYKWTSAATGDDEVALWLDPASLGAPEAGVPEPVLITTSGGDVTWLSAFFLAHRTDASGIFHVDEVRVATTWAEVTPTGTVSPPIQPRITQAMIHAGHFIIEGTNGVADSSFRVLSSSDITLPLEQWAAIATNSFDAMGALAWTNALVPGEEQKFFALLLGDGGSSTAPPSIDTPPASQEIFEGQDALFSVVAGGTAPLSYYWYFNTNTLLSGSALLTITNAQTSHSGAYHVIVTNSAGAATSAVATLTVLPLPTHGAPSGFATLNGGTIGGAGGPIVTVTNFAQFDDYARVRTGPYIIQVRGTINLGTSNARITSNKTLVGLGTNATLVGNLKAFHVDNIIIQNLTFTNPDRVGDGDGITLDDTRNVWVDHCTCVDCGDGSLDITHGSDWVTVSWCRFYYTFNSGHNFVNLIGNSDSSSAEAEDAGRLHVTMHHNWWSTLCVERMPRVRFGRVHSYNNYFNSPGNNYCLRAARDSESLLEFNYFENVKNPWELYRTVGADGKVYAANNIQVNTTWSVNDSSSFLIPGTDVLGAVLNPPPYAYEPDAVESIPALVTESAGAGKGPFAP